MTERIFQSDAYCQEISAPVTGRENRDNSWRLRLARTIFRPVGGGQPADQGTINGLPLLALEEDGDDIVHVLANDPGDGMARLQLDFARRFDHMQQHTAQHLLSQVLLRLLDAPTLSFAIGPEHSSIEIGRPAITTEEVRVLELECARQVFAALPVRVFESADPAALELRKPPKRQGRIRVVEIEGLDRSACGGTHVRNSAEIGPLKIVGSERVRANVRLYYAAGGRALRDYQLKHDVLQRLQRRITQPLAEIPDHVEALLRERDGLRRELKKAQRRELEREIAAAAAHADPLALREFSGLEPADLRFFVTALVKEGRSALAYQKAAPSREASAAPASGYVVAGCGRPGADLRAISAPFFTLLAGKGGGSAGLIEGRAGDLSRLAEAAALLRSAAAGGSA
jgi:alanyl-tRNA synthetase